MGVESDWLFLSVDTSAAITVLFSVATLGCLYRRNEMQPATSQCVHGLNIQVFLSCRQVRQQVFDKLGKFRPGTYIHVYINNIVTAICMYINDLIEF